jgi:hypothetical protein
VRSLGFKGQKEWRAWAASGKRPLNIPSNPEKIYAGKGWTNSGDWLGTGRIGTKQIGSGFLPYDEANTFVRALGLEGYEDWAAMKMTPQAVRQAACALGSRVTR